MEALRIPELDQCVHCGLCLNHCPTYRVTGLETESPRGRIHLVHAAAGDRILPTARFAEHLYLCLMCRACETACPSGVQYGRIAEAAREVLGPPGSRAGRWAARLAFTRLFPHLGRLRVLARVLRFYQRSRARSLVRALLPRRFQEMEALLPPVPERFFTSPTAVWPALSPQRARVALLSGCVMPLLFGDVNEATLRVLQRNGFEVVIPPEAGCCGALNVHNGETTAAKAMARRNVDLFLASGADAVIVNAAGCGATMKEYAHLLRDEPSYAEKAGRLAAMVKDLSEFLAARGLTGTLGRLEMTVTYQDPCHLAHGQKVRAQPRQLLQAIPGLTLIEMDTADRCCGSAGIYNITHPHMSQVLLAEKMESVARTGARAVVAPNPGCMLQLRYGAARAGMDVAVYHLADLLERAYQLAETGTREYRTTGPRDGRPRP